MTKRRKRVGPTERLPLAQAKDAYPVQLTERDIEIFKVLASGVQGLTTQQISRLFFPGDRSKCTRRLQKLFQNRFISREKINLHQLGFKEGPEETLLHILDEEGARVVAQQLGVPVETIWQPSDKKIREQNLRHLILNNDIRISIKLAVEALGYTVESWETDQTLRRKPTKQRWMVDFVPSYGAEGESETGEIVPDDLLTICTPTLNVISLIELDTGSEVRTPQARPKGKDSSVASKTGKYLALFDKPSKKEPSKFELATGIENQRGVRVFFITTGGELAVQSLLNTIKEAGGRNTFWVGRYELARNPNLILTRPLWRKAGDNEPAYYPWIGMSKLEEVRYRLRHYGVASSDIEAHMIRITDLAESQLIGWSKRKQDMSLEQAVALRSDELAEAILKRFEERLGKEVGESVLTE